MDKRTDKYVLSESIYIDGRGKVKAQKYMLDILRDTGYCKKCCSLSYKVKQMYKSLL
jgi:hypothetical protein